VVVENNCGCKDAIELVWRRVWEEEEDRIAVECRAKENRIAVECRAKV
jgi:hypothetical protein